MKICYRYINREGKKRSGVVEASSLEEAKQRLSSSGTYVISMYPKRSFRKKRIALKEAQLALLTSQLAHLLNAGIPLYESLLSLCEQYAQEAFLPILTALCEEIKRGSSLAEALERSSAKFSRLYISMVRAGEAAGSLAITLERLAQLLSKQSRLKKQLLTALLYPMILLGFSSLLIVILLTYVVPSLEALFCDMHVNRFTRAVFGLSHFIKQTIWFTLPLFSLSVAALVYYLRQAKGRLLIHKALLKMPLVKTVVIHAACARFCRTMGTLLEGGVSIISALQTARGVMKQPILEKSIENAEKRIIEGSLLSIELGKASWMPPLVPRMLAIGEEGGTMAVMLGKVADLYEDEVEKLLTRLANLAQPVILLFLGAVVGLIMLAILLPLTDVSGFMSGGL